MEMSCIDAALFLLGYRNLFRNSRWEKSRREMHTSSWTCATAFDAGVLLSKRL